MAPHKGAYEVLDAETGELLSRHRTRQAAVDHWRYRVGTRCRIELVFATGRRQLVAEGVWHMATRSG